ncbi:MAG: hypothetical protein GY749_50555 [Desulfobacteraceae bacterium]|nr:hypothetical protein [Desulfobacteraceae bacterium]
MGMFDTIMLDRNYECPACEKKIHSSQVKVFDNSLEEYQVRDCVSHAEEIRIVKDELFCDSCSKYTGKHIYHVVNRGILLGTAGTLKDAEDIVKDLSLEKLILWYHDLYRRYVREIVEKETCWRFLDDLREWYGERCFEKYSNDPLESFRFIHNRKHLKGALTPLESVERFLTYERMLKTLDDIWKEGGEALPVYYSEDIKEGEEIWAADVYQDDINDRCGLNWTWTVMSRKYLETDEDNEDDLPEWSIVVDKPFSERAVCMAVNNWLKGRGFEFNTKMIPFEHARFSGLLKELMQKNIESEKQKGIPVEDVMKELSQEDNRRMAEFIDQNKNKSKVFAYQGFYGSLVPDPEYDRLVGKVEKIKENIVYEGRTVKECEQRFRKAVTEYQKGNLVSCSTAQKDFNLPADNTP